MKHLILFDDRCSLCWRSVNHIRDWDKKKQFLFSPIREKLVEQISQSQKNIETLVLVENYHTSSSKIWVKGRAVMRILWLIGGFWKLIGWLAFIPYGIDFVYSWVAKKRHKF